MAKLVLTLEGKILNHFFIEKPSITIGRDIDNDIAIDDALLGNVHVRIVRAGQDDIVEGLESESGARINGKPLVRQILQHRDIIELGSHQLRYMSSRAAVDTDLDRTMLIQTLARPTGAPSDMPAMDIPRASTAKPALQAGRVEVLGGLPPHQSGQFVSLDRVVTTFGVPGEQLIVLTRRPHGVFLTHVDGPKFPRVNRGGIGNTPYALKDGDLIEAAGYKLKFIA